MKNATMLEEKLDTTTKLLNRKSSDLEMLILKYEDKDKGNKHDELERLQLEREQETLRVKFKN